MLGVETLRSTLADGAVRFELATPADDGPLRELLWRTPMRGAIDLAFLREPSYFRAAGILGETVQTIVARHRGAIIGVGTRALRPTRINGEAVQTGYLGDLRVHPEHRGGTVVARGYRFLRELHADGRAALYATVIVEDNETALRTVAANRADLPRYADRGRILTPMLHLNRRRRRTMGDVEHGSAAAMAAIVEKLNENRLQFAPIHDVADFGAGGRFPGLRPRDFLVLRRAGRIAGVLALWNQRAFRQTRAIAYHGWLRVLRPTLGWLSGAPLPAPGEPLRSAFVAFVSTDDVDAFRILLSHAHAAAREQGHTHLIVGLHERDPRARVLREYRRTRFAGRLFSVDFGDGPRLDGRVPYVEAGLL